jgi:hypothetical protein
MDGSSRQQIMDFWYKFDNTFHFQIDPTVDQYYQELFYNFPEERFDHLNVRWLFHKRNQSYPDGLLSELSSLKPSIVGLANEQMKLINSSLHRNLDLIQKAFEDFGQGILYDDRRALKLHKMDGQPPHPLVGYFRWHTFIRIAGLFPEYDQLWPQIDQYVGLAWAIQSIAPIQEQDPNNPGLDDLTLDQLRKKWLSMQPQDLDDQFENGFNALFP